MNGDDFVRGAESSCYFHNKLPEVLRRSVPFPRGPALEWLLQQHPRLVSPGGDAVVWGRTGWNCILIGEGQCQPLPSPTTPVTSFDLFLTPVPAVDSPPFFSSALPDLQRTACGPPADPLRTLCPCFFPYPSRRGESIRWVRSGIFDALGLATWQGGAEPTCQAQSSLPPKGRGGSRMVTWEVANHPSLPATLDPSFSRPRWECVRSPPRLGLLSPVSAQVHTRCQRVQVLSTPVVLKCSFFGQFLQIGKGKKFEGPWAYQSEDNKDVARLRRGERSSIWI